MNDFIVVLENNEIKANKDGGKYHLSSCGPRSGLACNALLELMHEEQHAD